MPTQPSTERNLQMELKTLAATRINVGTKAKTENAIAPQAVRIPIHATRKTAMRTQQPPISVPATHSQITTAEPSRTRATHKGHAANSICNQQAACNAQHKENTLQAHNNKHT